MGRHNHSGAQQSGTDEGCKHVLGVPHMGIDWTWQHGLESHDYNVCSFESLDHELAASLDTEPELKHTHSLSIQVSWSGHQVSPVPYYNEADHNSLCWCFDSNAFTGEECQWAHQGHLQINDKIHAHQQLTLLCPLDLLQDNQLPKEHPVQLELGRRNAAAQLLGEDDLLKIHIPCSCQEVNRHEYLVIDGATYDSE